MPGPHDGAGAWPCLGRMRERRCMSLWEVLGGCCCAVAAAVHITGGQGTWQGRGGEGYSVHASKATGYLAGVVFEAAQGNTVCTVCVQHKATLWHSHGLSCGSALLQRAAGAACLQTAVAHWCHAVVRDVAR
jgi:hypothetical protein